MTYALNTLVYIGMMNMACLNTKSLHVYSRGLQVCVHTGQYFMELIPNLWKYVDSYHLYKELYCAQFNRALKTALEEDIGLKIDPHKKKTDTSSCDAFNAQWICSEADSSIWWYWIGGWMGGEDRVCL